MIENCTVSKTRDFGILVLASRNATISNSSAVENDNEGIGVILSGDVTVEYSEITGSGNNRIDVKMSSVTISKNKIWENNGFGISIESSAKGRIFENSEADNQYSGIRLLGCEETVLRGNNVSNNVEGGISL